MPPPEPDAAPGESIAPPAAPDLDQHGLAGIAWIRRALGLGDREQALVHKVGKHLTPYVEGWVDAFYTRLLTDSTAMRILADDARVIRLKRSLVGWFNELFTVPWDEDYERNREIVGDTHVRIFLPTYLMVTSMSRLRQDVCSTALRIYDGDPEEALEIADVLGRALDMELTLMLIAFRRGERAAAREKDRMVYAQRAARRLAQTLYDRVDAALCYADLAESDDAHRREHLTKLRDVLRGLVRHDMRIQAQATVEKMSAARVRLYELCRGALSDVSVDPHTRLRLEVHPPDLEARLVAQAVRLAVEELAQNGVRHAPGGEVRIEVERSAPDRISLQVTDEGPGWGPGIHDFQDIYALGSGLGLSFCELVAELHHGSIQLFQAPGGGAGVRLELREVTEGEA